MDKVYRKGMLNNLEDLLYFIDWRYVKFTLELFLYLPFCRLTLAEKLTKNASKHRFEKEYGNFSSHDV